MYNNYFFIIAQGMRFSQHRTSNFLVQCCLRPFQITLIRQHSYAILSQHGRHYIVQVTRRLLLYTKKKLSASHGPTLHNKFSCAMFTQVDPDKSIDYFLVKVFLWTMGQDRTGNFLVQCWPSQIKTTFYMLFSQEKMTVCYGPTLHK